MTQADFFLNEMDAIGLEDKTFIYRIGHLKDVTPNKLTPRWCRLYYPFQNVDATDISIDYDDGVSPLRDLSGNGGLSAMLEIGAYCQGPRRERITPRTAWPGTGDSSKYVQPGYGHYLAWLYSLERAGCSWICMYNARFGSPLQYPYNDPTWPAMLRAISDFLVDGISINSDLTDSNVPVGVF